MIGDGGNAVWKLLAFIDLSRADADRTVENAISLAAALHGDLTLLSVVARRQYERGMRYEWPEDAFGEACPEIDIHRVTLPGTPAEVLSAYADRIRADVLLIPGEYTVRRYFRKLWLAQAVAGLTSRSLCIVPPNMRALTIDGPLRVACILRLDGTDRRACIAARAVVHKCGGQLVLVYAAKSDALGSARPAMTRNGALEAIGHSIDVPWRTHVIENCSESAIISETLKQEFGLIVAGRPMYVKSGKDSVRMLSLANQLPCPVLSVPFSSVSTAAAVPSSHSVANT